MVEIKNGTEKQIAWANKIRESEMSQINSNIKDAEMKRGFALELNEKEGETEARNINIQHQTERIAFYNYMKEQLAKVDDAKKWISEARGIAERAYHSNNGLRNGKIVKLI